MLHSLKQIERTSQTSSMRDAAYELLEAFFVQLSQWLAKVSVGDDAGWYWAVLCAVEWKQLGTELRAWLPVVVSKPVIGADYRRADCDGQRFDLTKYRGRGGPRGSRYTYHKWRGVCAYDQLMRSICLDVKEDEQLYHHYITEICGSPRLRLRDGSPAVNLWRQPRGTVTLQGGGQVTLGAGQPGLADVGGTMTVEYQKWTGGGPGDPAIPVWCRINLYIEIEIKLDGKIPPMAREYRGTSKRVLTRTEQDQCQRQQAQLARGGCYIFADRVAEAIDELVRYRDAVLARV